MNLIQQQLHLKAMGFDPGPADDKMGPRTLAAMTEALTRRAPEFTSQDPVRRGIAVEQLIMREVGRIETGAIDGFIGPQTLYARTLWQASPWRDPLMRPLPVDPLPIAPRWPAQADVERFFGPVGKNQVLLDLPYPMRLAWDLGTTVRRISIHAKVADSAGRALAAVLAHYGESEVIRLGLDRYGGCYEQRKMRGGTAWSMHAWAIAIDFDPLRNQLAWGRDRANLALPVYAPFWAAWEAEGWLSLGRARNFDWMHVQAARLA